MQTSHSSEVLKTLAQAILKARQLACIKQVNAAKALDISRSSLSKYENGREVPTVSLLIAMSLLYRQPITSFFLANTEAVNVLNIIPVVPPTVEKSSEQLEQFKKQLLF